MVDSPSLFLAISLVAPALNPDTQSAPVPRKSDVEVAWNNARPATATLTTRRRGKVLPWPAVAGRAPLRLGPVQQSRRCAGSTVPAPVAAPAGKADGAGLHPIRPDCRALSRTSRCLLFVLSLSSKPKRTTAGTSLRRPLFTACAPEAKRPGAVRSLQVVPGRGVARLSPGQLRPVGDYLSGVAGKPPPGLTAGSPSPTCRNTLAVIPGWDKPSTRKAEDDERWQQRLEEFQKVRAAGGGDCPA